jgi:hypothetical protein
MTLMATISQLDLRSLRHQMRKKGSQRSLQFKKSVRLIFEMLNLFVLTFFRIHFS